MARCVHQSGGQDEKQKSINSCSDVTHEKTADNAHDGNRDRCPDVQLKTTALLVAAAMPRKGINQAA